MPEEYDFHKMMYNGFENDSSMEWTFLDVLVVDIRKQLKLAVNTQQNKQAATGGSKKHFNVFS